MRGAGPMVPRRVVLRAFSHREDPRPGLSKHHRNRIPICREDAQRYRRATPGNTAPRGRKVRFAR